MKQFLQLEKRTKSFFVATLLLFFSITTYAHVTEIRVNQNTDGTLTWYLQTYHHVNECGFSGAGIRINGVAYGINSTHVGSITGLSPTILAQHYGISWGRSSYAIVNTPYIAGNLNVVPYSNNVCWDFLVGGNGSFTPPPPPVCTTPPVTNVSNTLGSPNNNNTDCIVTDDTIPVTLNISHLACGNITGDGELSVYYSDGTLIGNVAYQNGISTPYTFNLPQGRLAQLTIIDNDFPNNPFNYSVTGLNGTSFTGATNITPITPVLADLNGQCNVNVALATTTDNCGGTIIGTTSDPLTYSNQGQYTINWTFDAGNGNTTTAIQNVTVKDTVFPSITSPFDITTNVDANQCGAFVTYGIPTANDNCGTGAVPTTLANHTYKGMLNGHSYFISNTVTTPEVAHANAIAAGGHLVTISDATENLFVSQFNSGRIWIGHTDRDVEGQWKWISNEPVTYTNWASGEPNNAGAGEDWAVINWSGNNPDWNDWYFNASAYYAIEFDGGTLPTTLVSGPASGDLFPVGTTTVTYEAIDAAGNRVETSFNVTVNDNVGPEFLTTETAFILLDENGVATYDTNGFNSDTVTDNCGIDRLEFGKSVFNCDEIGFHTISVTAYDINGNSTVGQINIEVREETFPTVITKDIEVILDENGNASIVAEDVNNGTFDNCSFNLSLDVTDFSCANVGNNIVNLTATDNHGLPTTATANVLVIDNTLPNVITKDISIDLDANGNASITPDMINNGSNDACGILTYQLNNTSFSCANVGTNEVTLTVTDNNNNISTATANVTVNDITNPIVATNDISINLDANGNATITTDMINNGSSDACGIKSLELDNSTFSCDNVGVNQVTLTVTDNNNNVSSATANVTVSDITSPTVITQSATITLSNGIATIRPEDVNNDSFDNCSFALSLDNDTFSCSDIGENTVTLTATDASGNTSSNTATVNVVGDIPTVSINDFNAVQTQKKNTIFLGFGPQSINLSTVTSGGNGFTYEWTTSTGELVSNEANPSISPETSTTYNVTVTNSNGCTASTSFYVCVIDARAFDKKGRYKGKVVVCHHTSGKKGTKHVTINISQNAVMTHLTKHGVGTDHADTLGGCDAQCVGSTNARSTKITSTNSTPSLADELIVFPNPSKGVFDVKLKSISSDTNVYLFDINGKIIESKLIQENESSENIITIGNYNLSSGFYLLKIINKNETVTKKLIVTKD